MWWFRSAIRRCTSPGEISKRVKQAKAEGRNSVLALIATQNGERFVALKLDNA